MIKTINWIFACVLILLFSSCNKIRTYPINIKNSTGFDIQELEFTGTTDYLFEIPKDGETGCVKIEWKGPRKNFIANN